jgi:ubiquinone/menaquinone biosynthesis C-methylase UbiE
MRRAKTRIPECGAIRDSKSNSGLTAERYGQIMRERLGDEYRRFAERAIESARPPEGGLVLEIGPGPGWAGIELLKARPDLRLIGLDASPDMIRAALKNAEAEGLGDRARYQEGRAETLAGLEDGGFDLVISRDSLHHWEDPVSALSSVARVLKPEGHIFICDERRDLGLKERLFLGTAGRLGAGPMFHYWKTSLASAYTKAEVEGFLARSRLSGCRVEKGFMALTILR